MCCSTFGHCYDQGNHSFFEVKNIPISLNIASMGEAHLKTKRYGKKEKHYTAETFFFTLIRKWLIKLCPDYIFI